MAWPFDSEEQLDEWADAFVAAHLEQQDDGRVSEASALANEPSLLATHMGHAEALWTFILKVVARRPSEWALEVLAAGPLEDLIADKGHYFIDRIELEARRDPVFRRTLHGVWRNASSQEVWDRVVRARGSEISIRH